MIRAYICNRKSSDATVRLLPKKVAILHAQRTSVTLYFVQENNVRHVAVVVVITEGEIHWEFGSKPSR